MTTERELVLAVLSGDEAAWSELVREYAPLVWSVARRHRLTSADAADAAQNTWMATAENLGKLRNPDRLAGWIATTARRECLNVLAHHRREIPADWFDAPETPELGPEPVVLRSARDRVLWQAFESLPERCRALLSLLAHAPGLTYAQLGRALGIKVNSVGQTRTRCLDVLRRRLAVHDIREESAG
ncbi:MAG: sigma-70 family RNA polymerase sigma factor [Actinophytocola sp.]|uniref:RNA polymerase sigma factor n=1 Tax=Actinophytocola sp. TaxID=1872138 RepID=UPI001324C84D|nr:sigma-70 family RNA polymerase sigma factor [Actinophytocola sp.]MPZ79799.1 sigma-70 family RNA polymerase sigma factor [Actinophytocola sp.]